MKSTWTAGQEPERVKDIVSNFKGGIVLRKRMVEILRDKITTVRTKARKEENYSSPNWPYQMAGLLERERAYEEIINLLEENLKGE